MKKFFISIVLIVAFSVLASSSFCWGINFPDSPNPGYTPIRYIVGEVQSFGFVVPTSWDSLQLIFNPDQIEITIVEIRGAKTWSANYYYGKNEMGICLIWQGNTTLVDLKIKLLKTGLVPLWYGWGMHNCGQNTFFWFNGLPTSAKGAGAPAKNQPIIKGKLPTTWGGIKSN